MGAIWDKKSVADSFRDEINNVKDDESLAKFVKSL
jgi:hypothetical protein